MIKNFIGAVLCIIAVFDLMTWIKRKKADGKAILNSAADILIIIYTIL